MIADKVPHPATENDPHLSILETRRVLRIARGGRLQRWLGPALRGLAGGRLKARVCRHPVADQIARGRWERCEGCPLMRGCAYGETIEAAPPTGTMMDALRPVVIAPAYPCPEVGRVGDLIPVRAAFIGSTAAAHSSEFWESLRVGGADPGLGLGQERVLFDVLPGTEPDRTEEVAVPADPTAVPGIVPRIRVVLTSPLILDVRGADRSRRLVERPTLANLLWKWDSLGALFRDYGTSLPDGAVDRVKELAAGVPTLATAFGVESQTKSSHRSGDRGEVSWVTGWGEYGPVPAGLLPWLRLAGRLHVGTHRVAGAGGWEVEAE